MDKNTWGFNWGTNTHPSLKEVKVISRCGNYLRCDSSEVPSEGVVNKALEKGSGKVEAGACQRGPWAPWGPCRCWTSCPLGDEDPLRKAQTPSLGTRQSAGDGWSKQWKETWRSDLLRSYCDLPDKAQSGHERSKIKDGGTTQWIGGSWLAEQTRLCVW